MKQAVTLALTLTLAAGLLAGCSGESAGGGVQPTGRPKHPLWMPHQLRRQRPAPFPTR